MVRSYKRKIDRATFCREEILIPVDEVISKEISLRKAASDHNVNYKTLSRYVDMKKKEDVPDDHSFGYLKTRQGFTKEIEDDLVEIDASKIFHGLTMKEMRELAYELAESNNVPMPETWKTNQQAGLEWAHGFMHRHPENPLRSPEATSIQRNSTGTMSILSTTIWKNY